MVGVSFRHSSSNGIGKLPFSLYLSTISVQSHTVTVNGGQDEVANSRCVLVLRFSVFLVRLCLEMTLLT